MASKLNKIAAVVIGLSLCLFAGCSWETGAKAGVIEGVSSSVSAIIEAVANNWFAGILE